MAILGHAYLAHLSVSIFPLYLLFITPNYLTPYLLSPETDKISQEKKMKYYQLPKAIEQADDAPAMADAIRALKLAGIDVRRPNNTPYQLKVTATISYYPVRGTIFIDGAVGALPQRGLQALLALLADKPCELFVGIQ